MSQRFTGRVAVVTGAGQSIGFECAAAFAREGAHAVITDVDLDKAKAAAERLQREGLSAIVLPIDVRDPDQMEQAVQAVTGQFGRLDVWVNNAGVAQHYESFDLPRDQWQMSMDVMLSGTFFGCQAAGRGMREHGGAIVNMASVNGFVPQPRRAACQDCQTSTAPRRPASSCSRGCWPQNGQPITFGSTLWPPARSAQVAWRR